MTAATMTNVTVITGWTRSPTDRPTDRPTSQTENMLGVVVSSKEDFHHHTISRLHLFVVVPFFPPLYFTSIHQTGRFFLSRNPLHMNILWPIPSHFITHSIPFPCQNVAFFSVSLSVRRTGTLKKTKKARCTTDSLTKNCVQCLLQSSSDTDL